MGIIYMAPSVSHFACSLLDDLIGFGKAVHAFTHTGLRLPPVEKRSPSRSSPALRSSQASFQ